MSTLAIVLAATVVAGLGGSLLLLALGSRTNNLYAMCGKCRYDVRGSIGTVDRCPECGSPFLEVGIIPPRRRRRVVMVQAGTILFLLSVLAAAAMLTASHTAATPPPAVTAVPIPTVPLPPGPSQWKRRVPLNTLDPNGQPRAIIIQPDGTLRVDEGE